MAIRKVKTKSNKTAKPKTSTVKKQKAVNETAGKEVLSPKVANKIVKNSPPKVKPVKKSTELTTNPEIKTDQNLVIIRHIKEKMKEGHLSISVISKDFNVSFQRIRYLCHAIAKKEDKSMIKTGRGEWIIE